MRGAEAVNAHVDERWGMVAVADADEEPDYLDDESAAGMEAAQEAADTDDQVQDPV